jgi:excisionase family DNA binding protein
MNWSLSRNHSSFLDNYTVIPARRVLNPRTTIVGILKDDVLFNEEKQQAPIQPATPSRPHRPSKRATLPEVAVPVRQRPPKEAVKEKDPLSITEAAKILPITTTQLHSLLDERKIYYVESWSKRRIPKKALENFVNGLPAITMLEENIAHYRANNSVGRRDGRDRNEASSRMELRPIES